MIPEPIIRFLAGFLSAELPELHKTHPMEIEIAIGKALPLIHEVCPHHYRVLQGIDSTFMRCSFCDHVSPVTYEAPR